MDRHVDIQIDRHEQKHRLKWVVRLLENGQMRRRTYAQAGMIVDGDCCRRLLVLLI